MSSAYYPTAPNAFTLALQFRRGTQPESARSWLLHRYTMGRLLGQPAFWRAYCEVRRVWAMHMSSATLGSLRAAMTASLSASSHSLRSISMSISLACLGDLGRTSMPLHTEGKSPTKLKPWQRGSCDKRCLQPNRVASLSSHNTVHHAGHQCRASRPTCLVQSAESQSILHEEGLARLCASDQLYNRRGSQRPPSPW